MSTLRKKQPCVFSLSDLKIKRLFHHVMLYQQLPPTIIKTFFVLIQFEKRTEEKIPLKK